jgi:RHS repeat-associated protein
VAVNGTNGTYALQNYTYNSSTGNLSSKAGVNYTYGDSNHDHAVTGMGSDSFTYAANGNQITRNVSGSAYTLGYDAENHLVSVGGAVTATFVYDGDGNRVKATVSGATTTYVGNYFEWVSSTSNMKKYYYAGPTRVAMRTGSSTINYLLGDHLGSTAITTNSSGVKSAEIRYYPWGTTRYTSGTTPTTFRFTGQRLESYINLYWYGSRWLDPALGRFIQPDSIIPSIGESSIPNGIGYIPQGNYSALVVDYHETQFLEQLNSENNLRLQNEKVQLPPVPKNVQAFDRYAYSLNNPVKYTDPSGHCIWDLCIVEISLADITILTIATFLTLEATQPGRPEAFAQAIVGLGEQASQGIQALFARKSDVKYADYLANKYGLTKEQRRALHDAITRQGLTKEQIEEEAAEIARLNKQKEQEQHNQENNDK